jgi:probable rRNA maturation factor
MPVCVKAASEAGVGAGWVAKIAGRAAAAARRQKAELAVVFVTAARIKDLNRYRGKEAPTDILSFPAETKADLGDIFICPSVARMKAAERGAGYREYLELLIVHGTLHLAGYDHGTSAAARKMERLENKILMKKP